MADTSQRSACSPACAPSSCAIMPRNRFGLTMLCAGAAVQMASARITARRIPSILASDCRTVDIRTPSSRQLFISVAKLQRQEIRPMRIRRLIAALFFIALTATRAVQTPEQYFGFRIGSDKKLVRWDKIVEYMQAVANGTDRVKFRNLGPTTNGNPFVLLEISSAENLRNLDKLKSLERKLYFQGGAPTDAERDEIFRSGKAVVFITNNIHSTEIGASQMGLELVHDLATSDSPTVKKVLDNVILLLVPSLNPDGQIMVTDWYNKTLGTPSEASPLPYLYHNYAGHDNNRDMYLFSQKESQMAAQVLWHEWFPSIWLDEHQQGASGPRIFTMPATDPINPNVDPLIYRLNGVFDPSGNFMYVASFGTDRVAQVDTNGNVLWFVEVKFPLGSGSTVDPAPKRGPRGLALNANAQTLY